MPDTPNIRLLTCAYKGGKPCREVVRFIKTWKDRPPTEREYYCELHGMQEYNATYVKGKHQGVYLTPIEGTWEKYYTENLDKDSKR